VDEFASQPWPQFLDPPLAACDPRTARAWLLPVPLESTVSYGRGTARGPQAILTASCQVELYDREFDREAVLSYGVHTLPALDLPADMAAALEAIARQVSRAAGQGKLVGALGGEHSLSLGVARGLHQALGGTFTVVQIDAHSDLRDVYEGSPYSHACVSRRLLEEPWVEQILQLGVRSVCPEEVALAHSQPDRLRVWYAEEVHQGRWFDELRERLGGGRVFLTFDVDGLDPGLVPSTGTPEPDGLSWRQALQILRCVADHSRVVGFDCVELAPVPGLHASDYAVAKLVYKMLNYFLLK
jgi:agmatinase